MAKSLMLIADADADADKTLLFRKLAIEKFVLWVKGKVTTTSAG
jgi:hypothetical protein